MCYTITPTLDIAVGTLSPSQLPSSVIGITSGQSAVCKQLALHQPHPPTTPPACPREYCYLLTARYAYNQGCELVYCKGICIRCEVCYIQSSTESGARYMKPGDFFIASYTATGYVCTEPGSYHLFKHASPTITTQNKKRPGGR